MSRVQIGDVARVRVLHPNAAYEPGDYELRVARTDAGSFAVEDWFGLWWFYRDTGFAYTGSAVVVGVISPAPASG